MHRPTRRKLTEMNPHLVCVLCGGYYVDATTIIECLHSFCRSCIVRYLDTSKYCPICDVQIHKTKPLLSIRSDQTLQEIVYKLVPGLFEKEMKRRRDFYAQHPEEAAKKPLRLEDRGEVDTSQRYTCYYDENISFSLEYKERSGAISNSSEVEDAKNNGRRYLRCPNGVAIGHVKKLLRAKYGLRPDQKVEVMVADDDLDDDFTLMDIAYIYAWRRKSPMRLFYRILEAPTAKRRKLTHTVTSAMQSQSNPEPKQNGSASNATSNPSCDNNNRPNTVDKHSENSTIDSSFKDVSNNAEGMLKPFPLKGNGCITVDHDNKKLNGDIRNLVIPMSVDHTKERGSRGQDIVAKSVSTINEMLNGHLSEPNLLSKRDVLKT